MPPAELRELEEAAGEAGLEHHDPVSIDGAALAATLRPADGAALARVIVALGRTGRAAVVRGAGTALEVGNPPRGAGLLLSVERLSGIEELDEGEGVCRVAAGTPLARVREKLADTRWELPLAPPEERATVGGCLAGARVGPRCLGFGSPRDVVLGLDVTLGSGERTRCGGRVVKNVTGYDLAKLYTGSLGTLGVIEAAWLRLRPRPERVEVLELEAGDLEAAVGLGLAAARRASARAVIALAETAAEGASIRLVVELAGDAAAVAGDAEALAGDPGARLVTPDVLDAAARRGLTGGDGGLRFRVSARASRLAACARTLREASASLALQPGLGLVHARFDARDADAAGAWQAVADAARDGGGAALLEAAPLAAKRVRDVFGGDPGLLALTRSLKRRFDPRGVLNPGRFLGGV